MAASKSRFPTWVFILAAVVLFAFWVMSTYNGLISADQGVSTSWSQVETQYQRRFDLIPNLIGIVEGAAEFEQSTLLAVTQARTNWLNTQADSSASPQDQIAAAQNLDTAFSRLLVSVESYPTLTATEGFKTLQVQLEGTENRIAVARQDFNSATASYNLLVKRFPGKLVAALFGFDEKPLFEATTGAETAPSVEFDFNATPATNQ